jgi:putative transposase
MDQDRAQQVALFRYSLIRELTSEELTPRERGALITAITQTDHAGPHGGRMTVSAPTLRRWVRRYRAEGFDGLIPRPRRQPNRTPQAVLDAAVTLKREAPRRTAAQVARLWAEAGIGTVSARTLQRHFVREGLNRRPDGTAPRAYGRFEKDDFGQLWTGDGLHGPVVDGRKAILCAFIDDWSRAIPGWRWGHAEDTVRLEAALRRGLESRGIPDAVFVDNGSAFSSGPFHRTLAVLGIRIIHSRPGQPASRGKIERFFRRVRDQFLVELDARGGADSLAELNELFGGWVEGVYHRTAHTETGQTPLARLTAGRQLPRATPAQLHEAFLWAATRKVTKTATISLHGNRYCVDPALVGATIELLFDPFDLTDIAVRYQGRAMGTAIPQTISRHTHPAARPEGPPPPVPSGIDYLRLVADRVAADQAARIAYHSLPPGQNFHDIPLFDPNPAAANSDTIAGEL